jgi:hypothetical protein
MAPGYIEVFDLWTVRRNDLHSGIGSSCKTGKIDMNKACVLEEKTVDRRPVNPTTLQRKVFQVRACVDQTILGPLFLELDAAP